MAGVVGCLEHARYDYGLVRPDDGRSLFLCSRFPLGAAVARGQAALPGLVLRFESAQLGRQRVGEVRAAGLLGPAGDVRLGRGLAPGLQLRDLGVGPLKASGELPTGEGSLGAQLT